MTNCPGPGIRRSRLMSLPPTETTSLPPPAPSDQAAALPPPGTSDPLPARVPGFEILGELGRGGMGVVYQARQVSLNRIVALKMILAAEHAAALSVARFRREAAALARLQHPN